MWRPEREGDADISGPEGHAPARRAILLATGNPPGPVRIKLRRLNANQAQAYPPDGETEAWWGRLKNALGTSSDAFVDASLRQLQSAAQLPYSFISETALKAALAMIEAAAPNNEVEASSTSILPDRPFEHPHQ
jgi:hypothetical protein